jgi:hypothetical protein
MEVHLSLDLKQVERPEIGRLYQEVPPKSSLSDVEAMAAKRGSKTCFTIQSNLQLLRMITSTTGQFIALMRLVSFDAWPLVIIMFLQTARPIIYGLSGNSFFGMTGNFVPLLTPSDGQISLILPTIG